MVSSAIIVFVLFLASILASSIPPKENYYSARIVGGSSPKDGQYPHQVSLRINGQHFCGGSIIGPKHILTAANCLQGVSASSITVVVGTNSIRSGGDSYRVIRATSHEKYDKRTMLNDIAVLKLSSYIRYNRKVKAIKLASSPTPPGTVCKLSGWGLTRYSSNNYPNNLQHIETLIAINTITCNRRMLRKGLNPVQDTQQCTHSPSGEGVCHGDSGGPLISYGRQVGIVSWAVPCATGAPDVFTAVYPYRSWIKKKAGV